VAGDPGGVPAGVVVTPACSACGGGKTSPSQPARWHVVLIGAGEAGHRGGVGSRVAQDVAEQFGICREERNIAAQATEHHRLCDIEHQSLGQPGAGGNHQFVGEPGVGSQQQVVKLLDGLGCLVEHGGRVGHRRTPSVDVDG